MHAVCTSTHEEPGGPAGRRAERKLHFSPQTLDDPSGF